MRIVGLSLVLIIGMLAINCWSQTLKSMVLRQQSSLNLKILASQLYPLRVILQKQRENLTINSKSHSLSNRYAGLNEQILGPQSADNGLQQDITLTLITNYGQVQLYFGLKDGFYSNNNATHLSNLQQQGNQSFYSMYIRQNLKLSEGVNVINIKRLGLLFRKQMHQLNIQNKQYCVIIIPKKPCQLILKYGKLQSEVAKIRQNQTQIISLSNFKIERKLFLLQVKNEKFGVKFVRNQGFPEITIYECLQSNPQCYVQQTVLPSSKNKDEDKSMKQKGVKNKSIKFIIQSMLTKTQQFIGIKAPNSKLYLQIKPTKYTEVDQQYTAVEVEAFLQPYNYVTQLKENQIFKEDLMANQQKQYTLYLENSQTAKITIQVYEGQIKAIIQQKQSGWSYSPEQSTGVIILQMPKQIAKNKEQRHKIMYQLQMIALSKDAAYSVVYSQGEYQIFINDGEPTSHILNPKQTIRFIYFNQKIESSPMYFSLILNNQQALSSLSIKIFYFTEQNQKLEYKPILSMQNQTLAKSLVIQVPGHYPKMAILLKSQYKNDVEVTVTINDEQIIYLPFQHNLPLHIEKAENANIFIDNKQEGFIQLTVKKCDEFFPKIAYSLNPYDFKNQIFEYESVDNNYHERVFRSIIKVKKGGGVYVKISGDGQFETFIQAYAKFIPINKKKYPNLASPTKGDKGEINYQLITNSKAQIWFKQLQCSQQCQNNVKYNCFWSTSRSDLFRLMMCPGTFLFKNKTSQQIKSESYKIESKPGRDGIIQFKHALSDPIIYLSIKAQGQITNQIIYDDIQIVNISGQLSRISPSFLYFMLGIAFVIAVAFIFILTKQARAGYTALSTTDSKKKVNVAPQTIKTV